MARPRKCDCGECPWCRKSAYQAKWRGEPVFQPRVADAPTTTPKVQFIRFAAADETADDSATHSRAVDEIMGRLKSRWVARDKARQKPASKLAAKGAGEILRRLKARRVVA